MTVQDPERSAWIYFTELLWPYVRGLEIEKKRYNSMLRSSCLVGEAHEDTWCCPRESSLSSGFCLHWDLCCGSDSEAGLGEACRCLHEWCPPGLGDRCPGPSSLLFPVLHFKHCCSHVPCYHFLRFARNADSLSPTFERLCFLGPGLTWVLVSRVPSTTKHCGKAELRAGLGARQLCNLGQFLPLSGPGGQVLSFSGVISAREMKFWCYFWFLCLAMNTHWSVVHRSADCVQLKQKQDLPFEAGSFQ